MIKQYAQAIAKNDGLRTKKCKKPPHHQDILFHQSIPFPYYPVGNFCFRRHQPNRLATLITLGQSLLAILNRFNDWQFISHFLFPLSTHTSSGKTFVHTCGLPSSGQFERVVYSL